MKSVKNDLTLNNIRKIFGEEMDRKLVPVFGELDGLKQQILGLDYKMDAFKKETKENFDALFEAVTCTNDEIDKNIKPRLKRLEHKVFAC